MKEIPIETKLDNIVLRGVLRYWAKDYCVVLQEPLKGSCGAHLMYAIPAKYVLTESENPNCIEFELLERSKDILKAIYLNKSKERSKDDE